MMVSTGKADHAEEEGARPGGVAEEGEGKQAQRYGSHNALFVLPVHSHHVNCRVGKV